MSKNNKILILILLAAGFLRLWGLGSGELVFDEGLYSFRSIGWLDYLESPFQTTPVQWLADGTIPSANSGQASSLPGWLKLSFHDHPPLFFLTQHIFFSIFGDSLFVSRLPSALFGTGFIYLIYLISKKLFKKESAGLISAFVAALSFAHVSLSRLAMMESVLFFFILLNLYCFLKLLEHRKHWPLFGLTLGLALLTKYIAVFLIPTYLVFLLIHRRDVFKDSKIYLALILALIIFSPVIAYNIYSYKTFGHFDLQLAYLLKQKTPWDLAEISGKTLDPFSKIAENLPAVFSPPLLILFVIGLALSLYQQELRKRLSLILISFLFISLLLIFTGSAIRFVSLYVIPLAFFSSALILSLIEKKYKTLAIIVLFIAAAGEIYFLAFSKPDYGVAKLDKYFDSIFKDGRSEAVPKHPNLYLDKITQEYAAKRPIILEPTGLIYDDNIALGPILWLFSRRQYYHGIPVMTADNFENIIEHGDPARFKNFTLYFIKAELYAPLKPIRPTAAADKIEKFLLAKNQKPAIKITGYGANDLPAFTVYKFLLK